MVSVYYVCSVLPSELAILDADERVLVRAKPQRCKIADLGVKYAADIPVDPTTGLILKSWCVVVVEASSQVHINLAKNLEIFPIEPNEKSRQNVRSFLFSKGEVNPPDDNQAILERLHPQDGKGKTPQLVNLKIS